MDAPHRNGNTPAPHATSGAFFHPAPGTTTALRPERPDAQNPTVFLDELTGTGFAGLLYTLGRGTIAAFPLANWVLGVSLVAGAVLALRGGAGTWAAAFLVTTAAVLRVLVWHASRTGWVRFVENGAVHQSRPQTLSVRDKVPVYVSGCLEVGEKVNRFSMLPGYYRSFATREHALLCLCRGGRRLLLGSWPDSEVGLWYAFFRPQAIRSLRKGILHFGTVRIPALAVEVDAAPTRGRVRRRAVETLYLAADAQALDRIEADLAADKQVPTLTPSALHQLRP